MRLPTHVRPETIELHFDLDPGRKTFKGDAHYTIDLEKRVRQIELHAANLAVSGARVTQDGNACRATIEAHPECETILVRFDRLLEAGQLEVRLKFRGQVRSDLRGLYRSTDREQPWIASQLCPTDARRFFPCFDEPGIKARYAIRVMAPADQTVLSNSPSAKRSILADGRQEVTFETTPPLSAYLVAVAVGPFEASRAARCGQTAIRVYTLPGRQPLASFARKVAVESLARLERWFDMPHPYAKLDLLALPDFAFGAMENAGAVFFRDSVLLLDEKEASAEDQMRTAETIAHELSHMWFGNSVTMAWWNDLWLNESFATWMAYEIVEDWRPEWRMWLAFIQRRESALEVDALRSSHPIAPPIRTAEEAHENFDAITYTKGAAVLRMLERFLGARVFRAGVRRYVHRHHEGAATAGDLWSALAEVSNLPIEEIVAPWTLTTGYPIVRATGPKGREAAISLRQERFLTLAPKASARARKARSSARTDGPWSIPWVGRVGRGRSSREHRHLLDRRRDQLALGPASPDWLYGNSSESGFFRADHGKEGFEALLVGVSRLSHLERLGFVGHQWALVLSGRAKIDTILDLIGNLRAEEDPDVLWAIERVLASLLRRVVPAAGPEASPLMRAWIAERFGPQVETLGLAGRGLDGSSSDSVLLRRRRARILSIVGGLAESEALTEICLSRATAHLSSRRRLPPGAADEVIRIAAGGGDAAFQQSMLDEVRRSTTPQIRRRFLFALAGFSRPPLLRTTLRATLDRKLAPSVDRASLVMLLLSSPENAAPTWEHLQKVWPRLEQEMPPILLARVAEATSAALPPSAAPSIRAFFRAHPLAAGSRVIRQVGEELSITGQVQRLAGADLATLLRESTLAPK